MTHAEAMAGVAQLLINITEATTRAAALETKYGPGAGKRGCEVEKDSRIYRALVALVDEEREVDAALDQIKRALEAVPKPGPQVKQAHARLVALITSRSADAEGPLLVSGA